MMTLPSTTKSRLKKIIQVPGVWEGDRRPLGNMASHLDNAQDNSGECVIWVDGSEGEVRAMDIVSEDMGIEAIARTLLKAIESPHHPALPYRPQQVIVRDRELQFFLRGVLQGLDIKVEYSPELPIIDQLFAGFSTVNDSQPSILPPRYDNSIRDISSKIWKSAPWELLTDSDILQIELRNCEIDSVYLCIMGMMSMEYGVLLYRSLESLQQFREIALRENQSATELEKVFLAQDCWFLNYEEIEVADEEDFLNLVQIEPFFGSLHPFEGMRSFLDEEEAKIVYVALESLLRFCKTHRQELAKEVIPALSKSCRVNLPKTANGKQTVSEIISTKVSTLPELTEELLSLSMGNQLFSTSAASDISIHEDLIPEGALVSLATIPQEFLQQLRNQSKTYCQSLKNISKTKELPTVFIQTTRPKAKKLIETIKKAGGLKAVCFNSGIDPFSGEEYELGMLQTGDEELYMFAEYSQEMTERVNAVDRWQQKCKKTKGYCTLLIAAGATGSNRGKPRAKDILALFESKSISGSDLGMGVLQLMPQF